MRTIIIIGGGAAGMMAAISASANKKKVILLEKNEKLGKKIFITGKGRCNITNACPEDEFLPQVMTNAKFMYSSFERFSNHDMMRMMEENGLAIKTERGGRVFPVSDRSSDVIHTLKNMCQKQGVSIHYNADVKEILTEEALATAKTGLTQDKGSKTALAQDKYEKRSKKADQNLQTRIFRGVRLADGTVIHGDALIMAMGGCSYTSTGSNGDGFRLAESIGHTIKMPYPSLVPFLIEEEWCKTLMGLTLKNVAIEVKAGKKRIDEGFGEFLFTHFGVSGPLILTASTKLGRFQKQLERGEIMLFLDLKPALDLEQLDQRFLREFDIYRNKNISNVIERLLPKKMVPIFLEQAGIPEEKKVRDITKQERRQMVELMKKLPMHVKGVRGFEEAIVTRGGVNVKEISPTTMESKKVSHVFFAGEMIDVDAVTGGYNLQIAWSTGYTAGLHA